MPLESSSPDAPPAGGAFTPLTVASPTVIAAVVAQLTEGVIVANAEGRVQFANDAAARLHGVARLDGGVDEDSAAYQLLTEDGRPYPRHELPLARAVRRGAAVADARWRIRRPDGSEVLAVGSARPVFGPAGERLGAVLTVRDDTARAAAERAGLAERRATRILERIGDAYIVLDRDFCFVDVNPAAERSMQKTREELLGRSHWEVFPASHDIDAGRNYRRAAREGVELHFTEHYQYEGYDVHLEMAAYPTDESGVAVFWRDVTARVQAEQALARQSALTRLVADNATSALFMMDKDGHPTYANPAAVAMTGYSLEEIRGMPLHYAVHHRRPDGTPYPMAECPIDRALPENAGVRAHEDVFVRKDGSFFHVVCAASPILEGGRPVGTVVEVRDVTAEKAAAAALRELNVALEVQNAQLQEQALELELSNQQLQDQASELEMQAEELQATAAQLEERTEEAERAAAALAASELRVRLALDAARMVAWEWDPAREQITTTENLREVYGVDSLTYSAAGFALVHPDDHARHHAAVAAAVEGGTGYRSEFRITRPDTGAVVWLEERGLARRAADGGLAKLTGVVMDVTARKRADLERAERERQLRALADAIPTLAWTARPDGYIDWYNARWYEYTGTTPEQMAGWGWQAVHDPAELPWVLETWQAGIAAGRPVEMTFPLRGADGRFRRFLTRIVPLRDAEGRVLRWFGTNTDVEAERAAREAAEHANQAKSDFLATMSHELRTPLNAIAGYAELMELGIHGPVTDQQREAISRIQRSQRHLLGLINDVLNFAKLEAGRVEYHVADVPVREAVDALEPLVAPQLRAKALRFARAACDGELAVRADPDKLQQVLVNLLSNAIKFTAAGGAVTVRCEARGADAVAIAVEDTGIGIAADRLEQVFAPFVQIDRRLNAPHEGTGLGLAISRDLARGMGGDLTAESTPGAGSTFTLTLPRA